jgi:MmyB-like transcription regulator ligand binding domain
MRPGGVRYHDTGIKQLRHPTVGDLALTYETMQLSADDGLVMFAYTAEPGTKSAEALNLLGSWAATLDQTESLDQAKTPATDGA